MHAHYDHPTYQQVLELIRPENVVLMNPSRRVLSAVTWLLSLLGVSSVAYGIWLALIIVLKGG
jgi:hypothetical protein